MEKGSQTRWDEVDYLLVAESDDVAVFATVAMRSMCFYRRISHQEVFLRSIKTKRGCTGHQQVAWRSRYGRDSFRELWRNTHIPAMS